MALIAEWATSPWPWVRLFRRAYTRYRRGEDDWYKLHTCSTSCTLAVQVVHLQYKLHTCSTRYTCTVQTVHCSTKSVLQVHCTYVATDYTIWCKGCSMKKVTHASCMESSDYGTECHKPVTRSSLDISRH